MQGGGDRHHGSDRLCPDGFKFFHQLDAEQDIIFDHEDTPAGENCFDVIHLLAAISCARPFHSRVAQRQNKRFEDLNTHDMLYGDKCR